MMSGLWCKSVHNRAWGAKRFSGSRISTQRIGTGGKPVPYQQAKTEVALFDLDKDVGETTNVAALHPDVVERLKALAEKAREDLGDSVHHRKRRIVGMQGEPDIRLFRDRQHGFEEVCVITPDILGGIVAVKPPPRL